MQSSMTDIMLWTLLIMALACWFYTIAVVLTRVRSIILERESGSVWVKEMLQEKK